MSFTFHALDIPDVIVVRPTRHDDDRGSFMETYKVSAFRAAGIDADFVQDNRVRSGARVLRGLHFQRSPRPQGKLVQVTHGRIFDVAVDLRPDSPTYARWAGYELDGGTGELLWIPPGFAHGYVVLSDGAEVAYKVTEEYEPTLDAGVRWNDPTLAVEWPVADPVLSPRDQALPNLADCGVVV